MHEIFAVFSGKNKNISNCHLMKILPCMPNDGNKSAISVASVFTLMCVFQVVIAILQMIVMFFVYMLMSLNGLLH